MKKFTLCFLWFFGFVITVRSQPKSLDSSFNGNGLYFFPTNNWSQSIGDLAIQADGKIVVGAFYGSKSAVARLQANGTPDKSFGNNGGVIVDTINGSLKLLSQPDGKIIIIGSHFKVVGNETYYLTRLNADGSVDEGFGTGGVIIEPTSQIRAATLQQDGKIVLLKRPYNEEYKNDITRLNQDGSLDKSFGVNGHVIDDYDSTFGELGFITLAINSQGNIIASGYVAGVKHQSTLIANYESNGTRNANFGTNGLVRIEFQSPDDAFGQYLKILPDDDILVSGDSYKNLLIAKCKPTGALDLSYGDGGKIVYPFSPNRYSSINDMAVLANGTSTFAVSSGGFISFSPDGKEEAIFNFPVGYQLIAACTYQPDGKLVVTGGYRKVNYVDYTPVVARFENIETAAVNSNNKSEVSLKNNLSITVFPNPASATLNISGLAGGMKTAITILDNNGKIVRSFKGETNQLKSINIANLNSGIYYLQVQQNDQIKTLKFLKK